MTGMASKGIFESRGGNKEREAIWHNIANNFQKLRRVCRNGAKSWRSFY